MRRNRGIDQVNTGGDGVVDQKLPKPDTSDFDPGFFKYAEGHPRKWVILRDTGQPNENKRPFVALNGVPFWIVKNEPILVPVPVIEMMKKCIYTKIERDQETGEEFVRHIPRFSIEYVERPENASDESGEKTSDSVSG